MTSGKPKILFIDPPGYTKGLHTGFGLLSSMLGEENVDAMTLDLNNTHLNSHTVGHTSAFCSLDLDLIRFWVKKVNPDAVGLTVSSLFTKEVMDIIRFVKDIFPEKKIILGGPHMSFDGVAFMKETGADVGVVGEGEYAIRDVVEYLNGEKKPENINGILYRSGDEVMENPRREFIRDLDSLPLPDYDNFTSVMKTNGRINYYPITTSRGCPYSCSFCCSHKISGKRWRARSPENVLMELRHAREKYGIESATIVDDNFTLDKERADRICDLIIGEELNLRLDCLAGVRADRLDNKLLSKMKKAGFESICIGIESIDPMVFNAINKGETLEDIKKTLRAAREVGLKAMGFFVIGLPYSTFESDMKSIEFAKKHRLNVWWSIASPYPYTEMWDWVQHNARPLSDYKNSSQITVNENTISFDTKDYPAEKRIEAFYRALLASKDFTRVGYPHKGLGRYLRINALCLGYNIESIIPYNRLVLKNMTALLSRQYRKLTRIFNKAR